MSSLELDDDVCHSDVVVLEQPHCDVGHSIALVSGDSTEETTSSSGNVDTRNLASSSRARLRWLPASTVSTVKNGRVMQVAPFLTDPTNLMDIMLVRQLIADLPFEAPHGKSMAAWATSAKYLSISAAPDGNAVFPSGCKARQMKSRFLELMAFIKKFERSVPMNSGCDDEDRLTELQLGLEELLVRYSAATNNAAMLNTSLAAEREKDKKEAKALRDASMGEFSVEQLRNLRQAGKRKHAPNCVSPIPSNNDIMAFHKAANKRMEARGRTKESISKEKLVLKAKQLQMKEVEQERAFKLKEQELKLQADMFRFFQEHMSKKNNGGSGSSSDE